MALPVDRTMRDATLLERALHDLEKARLPRGTEIGFVNPVPRRRFDLLTGRPTAAADTSLRTSYYPIDAAMRGGETIRIFLPGSSTAASARPFPTTGCERRGVPPRPARLG